MSTLEARYRRLLAWYPAAHRATHEREMLDLLLSAARPGQTRPSPAEIADLLAGAIRIRLRPAVSGDGPSAWPAALALTGFLALLQLLANGVRFVINIPTTTSLANQMIVPWSTAHQMTVLYGMGPYWLAWAGIAVLAWRGRRAAAARAACAVTGVQIVLAAYGQLFATHAFGPLAATLTGQSLPLALLATASLVASPGPFHAARLAGRVRVTIAAATAAALAAGFSSEGFALLFGYAPVPGHDQPTRVFLDDFTAWEQMQLAGMSVAAVLVFAVLARTREGRRACALLAIAAVPALGLQANASFETTLSGLVNGNGHADPSLAIAYGLIGFALAMLCVRLVELPTQTRTTRQEHIPG
ncbi:hypothetical protein [Actinomadura oligospora]|uniref:hypothetical protein n=1 Tax=Actinomadura oligospora TaxID=111804 RepID=UPI0004B3FFC6|nr:hypothetical protein [Actinomadura oligospora]